MTDLQRCFAVDPAKKIRLTLAYPASTGRNFAEILRVIDSLQLGDKHRITTPVNWQPGQKVIVHPSVKSGEEAEKLFPGYETVKVGYFPALLVELLDAWLTLSGLHVSRTCVSQRTPLPGPPPKWSHRYAVCGQYGDNRWKLDEKRSCSLKSLSRIKDPCRRTPFDQTSDLGYAPRLTRRRSA